MRARTYNVVTFFCGSGYKTLGLLRARSRAGSKFVSVGAFDLDPVACADFELLTGAMAQVVDLGVIESWELAKRCEGVPDFVVMSPPCKGFSGCLPESLSKSDKYESLNRLAHRAVKLAIDAWLPKVLLMENVPRMLSRGKKWLDKITKLLRKHRYEVDLEPHDCGEWGGLAQKRERLLLVARQRSACPSHLLRPPNLGLRPMASVLWQLPPPVPGSSTGGPHHRLPKINRLNWLRLATIPAGQDWRSIPERVHMVDADPRMGGDAKNRQTGFYGVCASDGPSHTVIAHARAGNNGWASVTDPRLGERSTRQNGGFGVGDGDRPGHAVMAEGSVRNTWSSISDPRLGCSPRSGTMGVSDTGEPARTVIGHADVHNSTAAVADPRSECVRREGSIGVSDPARPYPTSVIGHPKIENNPSSVADPRLDYSPRRDSYGVQATSKPSKVVRGEASIRQSPTSIADDRPLFAPTHELVAGQLWTGDRDAWVRGDFWLVGPPVKITKGARGGYMIVRAPDNTVHRPMTTAELILLQGGPVWHRPGDPTELEIGDPSGQWVQMSGPDSLVREHVGNAVPPATAQAFGAVILELLDLGASEVFTLSSAGIWVRERDIGTTAIAAS